MQVEHKEGWETKRVNGPRDKGHLQNSMGGMEGYE